MSRIIHAKAVLSAEDKTGNVLDAIAKKFKGVEKAAKGLAGIKAPRFMGDFSAELGRLKATEKELDKIRKSFASFDAALKSGGPMRASKYFDNVKMWESQTIGALRRVRAQYGEVDHVQNRFFARAGRHMATAAGIGTAGYMANRVGRNAIKAGATSARESARDYMTGMSDAESKRLEREAMKQSAAYPSVDSSAMHERLRDTSMSMRSADKAIELGETIAQMTTVLQSLKGKDKALEEGRKFFSALDVLGKNVDPKEVKDLADGFTKAVSVEGADLDLRGVLQMARRSKSAGGTLSNRFLMTTGVGLGRDMGDERAGNALAMMMQQEMQATKQAKAYGQKYGLRDKTGKFVDRSSMQSDPDSWAWKNITEAMKRAKLDPSKNEDINTFLGSAYSNSSARDVLSKTMSQREQYEGKALQFDQAKGLEGAKPLLAKDPFVGYEAVLAQLRNLATQAPLMDAAASGLAKLSAAIGSAVKTFSEGDKAEKIGMGLGTAAVGAGAVTGGLFAARGLYQLLTGGGPGAAALLGSAAALDASALALQGAAAAIARGSVASQAATAATAAGSGAAAAGGGAAAGAAAGGLKSALWGMGAAALPWIGGAATAGAGMLGMRAAIDDKGWAGKTSGERMRESRGGRSVREMLRDQWGDTTKGPEVSPTMTYGTGASGDRASGGGGPTTVELTGTANVEGQATVIVKVEAGSTLLQVVEQARTALKLAGQLQANGAGSTGRSSPDAAAPGDVGKRGGL